ncbi:CoA ester lyase [Terrabacter sp. MAHUQ-38]|uniref:HpcH/HpaI aldolase/citrate lyase family protein n=1 Tax=unclassified Terrabacter TaxID=2630222 RepID=UPI00165E5CA7|nr:CoA ester lyase [Terrabacter sp. MAHUQ-38]
MTSPVPGTGPSRRSPLTWLYVPGDREDRIPKAFASGADVVVIDLEDAVAQDVKDAARRAAQRAAAGATTPCQVRVNALGSRWAEADLGMVAALPPHVGVRVPKCEQPADVVDIAEAVGPRPLHLLVESARGLEAAHDLARAHGQVATIGLGEADLRADLGVADERGLLFARSRVVVAAAAAGLEPPSMSVFTDVRALDALRQSCIEGRRLGLVGRAAIHPVQLPVIEDVFAPSAVEIARAREVVEAAATGADSGRGAVALADGRFVDEAVVRQARRLLARAGISS